jgi:hypothetical protein
MTEFSTHPSTHSQSSSSFILHLASCHPPTSLVSHRLRRRASDRLTGSARSTQLPRAHPHSIMASSSLAGPSSRYLSTDSTSSSPPSTSLHAGPSPSSSTPPSTAAPPSKKQLQGWKHSAAGSLGGMTGAIVTSPFDVVKVGWAGLFCRDDFRPSGAMF